MKKRNILFGTILFLFTLNCYCQAAKNNLFQYSKTWQESDMTEYKTQTLLNIKNDSVYILRTYYCDATGGGKSFAVGSRADHTITSVSYTPLFENLEEFDNGPTSIDTIQLKIVLSTDRMHLKTTSYNYAGPEINLEEKFCALNYTFIGGIKNFREFPTIKSQIISKIDVTQSKIELLEIGKPEKIGKKFDQWYKVAINNKIGWIFGGLEL